MIKKNDYSKKCPSISVVMPVYNSKNTIRRSIDSILSQTYRDFEFIIINEGKTDDGTTEILKEYERADERIVLVNKSVYEKCGIAISLNIGLEMARGKYIARMDADDYSFPERLRKQFDYMEKNPNIVVCGTKIEFFDGRTHDGFNYYSDNEMIKADSLFENPIAHPTVIIRKSYIDQHGLKYSEEKPNVIPEDYDLWLRILDIGGELSNLDEVLLKYSYDNGDHLSNQVNEDKFNYICSLKKNKIKKDFEINTEDIPNWYFLFLFSIDSFRRTDRYHLAFVYRIFAELEEKNDVLGNYSTNALAFVLSIQWNRFYKMFLQCKGLKYDFHIDTVRLSNGKKEQSFREMLADTMGVKADNVYETIVYELDRIKRAVNSSNRIVIFGTGVVVNGYIPVIEEIDGEVIFCDNNRLGKTSFIGKPLISPGELKNTGFDLILIGSNKYYDEIKKQLIDEYGISEEIISSIELLKYLDKKD